MKLCMFGALVALIGSGPAEAGEKKKDHPPTVKVGQKAPQIRLRTADGMLLRSDTFFYPEKSKSAEVKPATPRPVLIEFFVSRGCPPCEKALPDLVTLHEKYSPRGLEVLLVVLNTSGRKRAELLADMKDTKLPFPIVFDPNNQYVEKYLGKTVVVPTDFLVDGAGTVRQVRAGTAGPPRIAVFEKAIEAALAKPVR